MSLFAGGDAAAVRLDAGDPPGDEAGEPLELLVFGNDTPVWGGVALDQRLDLVCV